MLFETHCHSWYSKGTKIPWECTSSPKDIVKRAKKLGLTGIALTDHNTIRGWKECSEQARRSGIVFIPGIELQTMQGHVIGLGINEGVEKNLPLEETIEIIHEQGGLAVAPHPFDLKGDGIGNMIGKADAVEVFNAMNLDKLSNRIAERKAEEIGKPMVAGSDAHSLDMIGYAVNISGASDLDSFLKELKAGTLMFRTKYLPPKVLVEWYRERFMRSYIDVLEYIRGNYVLPKAVLARTLMNRFIRSRNVSWEVLAKFGLGVSRIYSRFKLLGH